MLLPAQHFSWCIRLLQVKFLPDETSETKADICRKILIKIFLNCAVFVGSDKNINLGVKIQKVYSKLKLGLNDSMQCVCCLVHILHVCLSPCANSLQSCPTVCDPMDCSLPGSSVQWYSPGRILEWVVMPSSRGSSQPWNWTWVSCVSYIIGGFFTSEPPGNLPYSA